MRSLYKYAQKQLIRRRHDIVVGFQPNQAYITRTEIFILCDITLESQISKPRPFRSWPSYDFSSLLEIVGIICDEQYFLLSVDRKTISNIDILFTRGEKPFDG